MIKYLILYAAANQMLLPLDKVPCNLRLKCTFLHSESHGNISDVYLVLPLDFFQHFRVATAFQVRSFKDVSVLRDHFDYREDVVKI